VVEEFVECGLDRATGEEHVIDEDDCRTLDIAGNRGGRELLRNRVAMDVIAMKRDIDHTDFCLRNFRAEFSGEDDSAICDAEEKKPFGRAMAFTDQVSQAIDCGVGFICGDPARVRHEERF
jgi:hypothetical protein